MAKAASPGVEGAIDRFSGLRTATPRFTRIVTKGGFDGNPPNSQNPSTTMARQWRWRRRAACAESGAAADGRPRRAVDLDRAGRSLAVGLRQHSPRGPSAPSLSSRSPSRSSCRCIKREPARSGCRAYRCGRWRFSWSLDLIQLVPAAGGAARRRRSRLGGRVASERAGRGGDPGGQGAADLDPPVATSAWLGLAGGVCRARPSRRSRPGPAPDDDPRPPGSWCGAGARWRLRDRRARPVRLAALRLHRRADGGAVRAVREQEPFRRIRRSCRPSWPSVSAEASGGSRCPHRQGVRLPAPARARRLRRRRRRW